MKIYKVHLRGNVTDTETDFSMGFDIAVRNGGSLENVGKCLQDAIDGMKDKGHKIAPSEKPESKDE